MKEIDIKEQIGNLKYKIELNKHKTKIAEGYVERLSEHLRKEDTVENYYIREERDIAILNEIESFLMDF